MYYPTQDFLEKVRKSELQAQLFTKILPTIIFFAIAAIVIILIIKKIRTSNKRNYELAKFRAETERIKAEAMRDRMNQKGNDQD